MRSVARKLAAEGYAALLVDMYGEGFYSEDSGLIASRVKPLWANSNLLRARMSAWLDFLTRMECVQADRVGAMGFCFGGQCVLELARSGADVKAIVSFHGILNTTAPAAPGVIVGHVAVYTGGKDPHAPREHVDSLRNELIAASASWEIAEFGHADHAFTDPDAASPESGRLYDSLADAVSWNGAMSLFRIALAR